MDPQSTKERIIDVSIDLFSEKGYTETSVREIARGTGIKQSSIYNHFASKQAILDHILAIYISNIGRNTPDRKALEQLALNEDPRTVINSLFFSFGEEKYFKILRIILHEQYRNDQVSEFMRRQQFEFNEDYIGYALELLIKHKKIIPVNSRYMASIINALNIYGSAQYAHFSASEEFEKMADRDKLVEFLLEFLIQ